MRINTTARVSSAQQTARRCSAVLGKERDGVWQVWQTKLRGARDVVDLVIGVTVCVFNARLDRHRWDEKDQSSGRVAQNED